MKAPGLQMQFTFRIEGKYRIDFRAPDEETQEWAVINNELGGEVCVCETKENAQLIRDALNKYLEQ